MGFKTNGGYKWPSSLQSFAQTTKQVGKGGLSSYLIDPQSITCIYVKIVK